MPTKPPPPSRHQTLVAFPSHPQTMTQGSSFLTSRLSSKFHITDTVKSMKCTISCSAPREGCRICWTARFAGTWFHNNCYMPTKPPLPSRHPTRVVSLSRPQTMTQGSPFWPRGSPQSSMSPTQCLVTKTSWFDRCCGRRQKLG